jgi:hypothetical protein
MLFLLDDPQSQVGNKIEDQNDDLVQSEERVKDNIEGFSGHVKQLAMRIVDKIRGRYKHYGGEDKQGDVDDGTPLKKFS